MKRIAGLTVVFLFIVTASAFAQEPQHSSNAPAAAPATTVSQPPARPSPGLFGKASIERAVARAGAPVRSQNGKKPFFKTPWPYVIIGAVAVVVAIALSGGSSSTSGPY